MGLPARTKAGIIKFGGSLSGKSTLALLALSFIPILIISIVTHNHLRKMVYDRTIDSVKGMTQTETYQLAKISTDSLSQLGKIAQDQGFYSSILNLSIEPGNTTLQEAARKSAETFINQPFGGSRSRFDGLVVVDPNGRVLASSNSEIQNMDLHDNPVLKNLFGKNTVLASFDPAPVEQNELTFLSSTPIKNNRGQILATLIGAIVPSQTGSALVSGSGFFPGAQAYFLTDENVLLGINPSDQTIAPLPSNPDHMALITGLIAKATPQAGAYSNLATLSGETAITYVRTVPDLKLTYIIELPERIVYDRAGFWNLDNSLVFAIALLISWGLAFGAIRIFFNPINKLVQSALIFLEGDRSHRVMEDRKDELGILARTFNQMVQQLSDLSNTLDEQVEKRTQLIRMASDAAQTATATTDRNEMINKTANLVVERFGFFYASVFLLDETGVNGVCRAEGSRNAKPSGFLGSHVRLGSNTPVGGVLESNQVRLVNDINTEPFAQEMLYPGARSEVVIPITSGDKVLGALAAQNDQPNSIDPDMVTVLQILTSQVAAGLQNIQLLGATQVYLEETSLLYRGARNIAQAKSEDDALEILINTFAKTPYVCGIYSVEPDHIKVITIIDPNNPSQQRSAGGISLPLLNITNRLTENQEIIIENINRANEFDNLLTFFTRRNCVSAAIFPLFEGGVLSKIVIIGADESHRLTNAIVQPYTNLLAVTAGSLGRFKTLGELSKTLSELQALVQVSQALSGESDLQKLYQGLHKQIYNTIGSDLQFTIMLYDAEHGMVEIPYLSDRTGVRSIEAYPIDDGLGAYVLRNGKTLLINQDITNTIHELGAKVIGKLARSWLGVPLSIQGAVIGELIIQDLEKENRFTPDEVTLLETIAPQVAVSIRNAQLVAHIQKALADYVHERSLISVLLKNIPDQIYFKDADGRYLRASNVFANRFGMDTPDLLVGRNDPQLLGNDEIATLSHEEQDVLLSGKEEIGRIEKITLPDQSETWAMISHIPMMDPSGAIVGVLGISRDITDMKKTEEIAQKNAQQIRTAAEVARDATGSLDIVELLSKAVNLVRNRFGFYHASIFLVDPTNTYALLRESTGEAGKQMKAAHHRLAIGSRSIVGQATSRGEPIVINDVTKDPTHFANPLLPATVAELAIPLKIGDHVLGALDVQSDKVNAFMPEDISILQVVADQLAVAVYNAQLFSRAQENLSRHRLIHEITTAAASKSSTEDVLLATTQSLNSGIQDIRIAVFFINEQNQLEIRASSGFEGVNLEQKTVNIGEGPVGYAAENRIAVLVKDANNDARFAPSGDNIRTILAVPILYSGNTMGVLSIEHPQAGALDENDEEIIGTLGNSLGAILYNAQLIGQIRRQVDRQRLIYEVTSRIRRSVEIETILKTSATEICRALGAKRAHIEITPVIQADIPVPGENGNNHGQEEIQ